MMILASLYEIDQEILNCIDLETGEILDFEKLTELQMAREEKLENVALWIKNLNSDMAAYKAEIEIFKQRHDAAKNRVEKLKEWLANILEGQKMVTPRVQVTFRRSESVQIEDADLIPKEYIKEKIETSPDKVAIKEAIKSGRKVAGCELVTNTNISIK